MEAYRSAIFICKLKANKDDSALELDLPFTVYYQIIYMEGKNITYRLQDKLNKGKEVMSKVDYRVEHHANPDVKVEKVIAEAFVGNLGQDYETLKDIYADYNEQGCSIN